MACNGRDVRPETPPSFNAQCQLSVRLFVLQMIPPVGTDCFYKKAKAPSLYVPVMGNDWAQSLSERCCENGAPQPLSQATTYSTTRIPPYTTPGKG